MSSHNDVGNRKLWFWYNIKIGKCFYIIPAPCKGKGGQIKQYNPSPPPFPMSPLVLTPPFPLHILRLSSFQSSWSFCILFLNESPPPSFHPSMSITLPFVLLCMGLMATLIHFNMCGYSSPRPWLIIHVKILIKYS